MQLTYRGSVNRWECDENDHLNVRFCEHKLYQTLVSGLLANGCIDSEDVPSLPARIARQHIRFQAESRIAAPLGGYFSGCGQVKNFRWWLSYAMRSSGTVVVCSMLCDIF